MPELPEVETVRRALAVRLAGRRVAAAVQHRPDLRLPFPERLAERLVGRRFTAFRRRAKYLLADLDDGHTLLAHLGMSGRLVFDGPPAPKHEHLTLALDDGGALRFVDPRRFGVIDLAPTDGIAGHRLLAALGLEPLDEDFDGRALRTALGACSSPLKVALMDQRRVVGVGNIYASEGLFRAGLAPARPASSLTAEEADRLAAAIRAVLEAAIAAGGSSLRDYVQADGELGFFQDSFAVYGRAGAPCPACGAPVQKLVQAKRATFHCATCQPGGTAAPAPSASGTGPPRSPRPRARGPMSR